MIVDWSWLEEQYLNSSCFDDAVADFAANRGFCLCDRCGLYSDECEVVDYEILCPLCLDTVVVKEKEQKEAFEPVHPNQLTLYDDER